MRYGHAGNYVSEPGVKNLFIYVIIFYFTVITRNIQLEY